MCEIGKPLDFLDVEPLNLSASLNGEQQEPTHQPVVPATTAEPVTVTAEKPLTPLRVEEGERCDPSSTKHEQQLLEEIYRAAQRCRAAKKAKVPRVGIVFAYERKAFIDSTPVTEAESYGRFKIHGRDHHQYRLQLQQKKAVPAEVEYDEVPKGRVVYDTKTRKYTLLLDRCILKNERLVSRPITQMNLPSETETSMDSHYRYPACLRRGA